MTTMARKMTVEEHKAITVEGDRTQLIEGEMVQMDEPRLFHADLRTMELEGLPGIAVEIRSPSTWRSNVGKKKRVYEAAGLPEL